MRRESDLEYKEKLDELDPQRMAILMGLMIMLMFIPFILYTVGIIEVWLMSILFLPGLCVLGYMVYKYHIRRNEH